ncbi:TldD/PmbA family protein [Fusobacterium sp.]|uniref:TldD/PmbA family protein n=1 Tax=Fusobacterium sp. TaxID=68766 RepID=UPI00261AC649|nr:TldD/PmbA family protein [Fusobacterium sp.]
MKKEIFINKLFEKASKNGIEEFEVYFLSNLNYSIKVYQNKIDNFTNNQNQGISFRGKINGKMGYSYSESFEEDDIDFLIAQVLENASCIETVDEQFIFSEKENYKEITTYSPLLNNIDIEEVKEFLFSMEKYALSLDERVKKVNFCSFSLGESEKIIKNSSGLSLSSKENICYTYLSVVAQDKEIIKTGSDFMIGQDFSKFDYKKIAKTAVDEAISKFNITCEKIDPKICVIENLAFSSLLGAMSNIFSADAVQKNISKLKGKLNTKVASNIFTLIDNPHLENGFGNSAFDDEGVPTMYKEIIENGNLKTYLYNLKTANKDGVKSTGNAMKGSYKGTIGTSAFNLYVKPREKSFEELTSNIEEGVLITDFAGLHSGLNSISGDFSLAGEGFIIKNGKVDKALNQITIAGNFFELLENIEDIGNDLKFSLSSVGSPSIKVSGLKIVVD